MPIRLDFSKPPTAEGKRWAEEQRALIAARKAARLAALKGEATTAPTAPSTPEFAQTPAEPLKPMTELERSIYLQVLAGALSI